MTEIPALTKIVETIARRMGELRAMRQLSLQTVAERAGLSKSHVWELEQGRATNPSIETAVRLAACFGVSLDYLTGLSAEVPCLHPEAMRIACEVDALLRKACEPPHPTRSRKAGRAAG